MQNQRLYVCCVRLPLILAVILLCSMGIFSKRGVLDLLRIQERGQALSAQVAMVRAQKEELDEKIHQLQTEPVFQERLVRQMLGYVRSNEFVIEF